MPVNIQLLEDQVVWIQLSLEKQVEEVMKFAESEGIQSPLLFF